MVDSKKIGTFSFRLALFKDAIVVSFFDLIP